jgi:hypothetical protein
MDKSIAKHLGLSRRELIVDATWRPLPRQMLALLIKIAEREAGEGARPASHASLVLTRKR